MIRLAAALALALPAHAAGGCNCGWGGPQPSWSGGGVSTRAGVLGRMSPGARARIGRSIAWSRYQTDYRNGIGTSNNEVRP